REGQQTREETLHSATEGRAERALHRLHRLVQHRPAHGLADAAQGIADSPALEDDPLEGRADRRAHRARHARGLAARVAQTAAHALELAPEGPGHALEPCKRALEPEESGLDPAEFRLVIRHLTPLSWGWPAGPGTAPSAPRARAASAPRRPGHRSPTSASARPASVPRIPPA